MRHYSLATLLIIGLLVRVAASENSAGFPQPRHNLRKYRPVFVPVHGAERYEPSVSLEYYTAPPLDPSIYNEMLLSRHPQAFPEFGLGVAPGPVVGFPPPGAQPALGAMPLSFDKLAEQQQLLAAGGSPSRVQQLPAPVVGFPLSGAQPALGAMPLGLGAMPLGWDRMVEQQLLAAGGASSGMQTPLLQP